jgi:hypothetical protein
MRRACEVCSCDVWSFRGAGQHPSAVGQQAKLKDFLVCRHHQETLRVILDPRAAPVSHTVATAFPRERDRRWRAVCTDVNLDGNKLVNEPHHVSFRRAPYLHRTRRNKNFFVAWWKINLTIAPDIP